MAVSRWTWTLFMTAGLATGAAAWARERVVAAAPRSAALFERVGLPVNLDGLEIGPVHATVVTEGTKRVLEVESEVLNPRRTVAAIPPLRFTVRDAAGATLYTWTGGAAAKTIAGGGRVPVRARLASPPDGLDVTVVFAPRA